MTSLLTVLFPDPGAERETLLERLDKSSVLTVALSMSGLSAPNADVAGAIVDLLDQPVGHLALRAWAGHRSIAKARIATTDPQTPREVVRLFEHTIKSTHHPVVTAEVNGSDVEVVRLTLKVEITVSAANLVIENGEITSVKTGSSTGKATLTAGDVVLAEGDFAPVEVGLAPAAVALSPGVPHTADVPAPAPGPTPAAPSTPADTRATVRLDTAAVIDRPPPPKP